MAVGTLSFVYCDQKPLDKRTKCFFVAAKVVGMMYGPYTMHFWPFFSFILGDYIPLYVHAGLKNFFFHASSNLDCS